MREIASALTRIKGRWMMGGSAVAQCPGEWRDLLMGEDPDLNLLALVGEVTRVALRPTPAAALAPAPLLPRLGLPTLPEAHRPRFRRAMEAAKANPAHLARILRWLAGRGYVCHPADWLPEGPSERVPAIYDAWARAESGRPSQIADDPLTEETWSDRTPSQRLDELRDLRRRDPERALALVAACAAGESAEARRRTIETLTIGLAERDLPFLESLAGDRSAKVRALAASLAARLGRATDSESALEELVAFLDVRKPGRILRRGAISPRKLKTGAQEMRRVELLEQTSLAGLARFLDMTELEVVRAFKPGARCACTRAFVEMVARTGSASVPLACLESLLERGAESATVLPLFARLDGETRQKAAIRLSSDPSLEVIVGAYGDALGDMTFETLVRIDAFHALVEEAAAPSGGDAATASVERRAAVGLANLGLLLDATAARKVIDALTKRGVSTADPRLDLLNLNAALEGSSRP